MKHNAIRLRLLDALGYRNGKLTRKQFLVLSLLVTLVLCLLPLMRFVDWAERVPARSASKWKTMTVTAIDRKAGTLTVDGYPLTLGSGDCYLFRVGDRIAIS